MLGEPQLQVHSLRALCSHASKAFIFSAGMILAVAGLAKIWSAFGDAKALGLVDPIIGVKFGPLMLAAGLIEVAIALVCWFSKQWTTKYLLLAWLATILIAYRIALWYINWHVPCRCLGSLADALGVSPQFADTVMKGVLAYLGTGAYLFFIVQWSQRRRIQPADIM